MTDNKPLDATHLDFNVPGLWVVLVTPEVAQEWMLRNTHNRDIRHRVVAGYAEDMRAGAWEWNGETIKFTASGKLADGQHRLAAVVDAGVAIKMVVVTGLADDAQETVDTGARRLFSDVLKLRGEPNYVPLAATIRAIAVWEKSPEMRGIDAGSNLTHKQLDAVLHRNSWIREHMTFISRVSKHSGLPAKVVGPAVWKFFQIDPEDAEFFFTRLASDTDHHAGDPIYELRKTVAASKSVRGERSARYLLAVTIKAWNKFRDGETVGQLRFRPGGANPEPFPEPK